MPATLARGRITAIAERLDGLVRLVVEDRPCVAFPRLTGEVEIGDEVIVNRQAQELGLGSGGFDVVVVNLSRGLGLPADSGAHVMTLPYAPGQQAARFAEEDIAPATLAGRPVVSCGLHSQLAPVCAALSGRRVVYVQLGGGALPLPLSDTLRALVARGLISKTIAVAPCFGSELQCVNVHSGLATAAAQGADVVVCGIGPGIVGTGSRLGHGGLAVVEAANATAALGGRAVIAPRVSFADERERHQGLSHHTRTAIELCLGAATVAWPEGLDAPGGVEVTRVDVDSWRERCTGLALSHMGRGPDDDPWFFAASYAAGALAGSLC
ncbi:MAG: DUF3866 family protein [Gaiellales bacterium]